MDRLPNCEWIRVEAAAAYLKVHRVTVCRWIKWRILIGKQPKKLGPIFVSTASIRKRMGMPEVSSEHDEAEAVR